MPPIRPAPAARTEARMSGFSDYWKKANWPWQLEDLTQDEIKAVQAVARLAFLAGKREGKKEAERL